MLKASRFPLEKLQWVSPLHHYYYYRSLQVSKTPCLLLVRVGSMHQMLMKMRAVVYPMRPMIQVEQRPPALH